MPEETFEAFIARERSRLNDEREAIFTQQQELENKLTDINRELTAIDAYEAAKTGKAPRATAASSTSRPSGRRGSKRDEVLKLIQEGDGLTRGQILEKMGVKGNKSAEMSVSNALTALTKRHHIRRAEGRKYIAA